MKFPFYKQLNHMDCGATCLRMILKYYGSSVSMDKLRKYTETNREGASLMQISQTAERLGFRSLGVKINFEKLLKDAPLPCIVHWNQNHFVVVYNIKKGKVFVADPDLGKVSYSVNEFLDHWIGPNATVTTESGVVLLLEPTPQLGREDDDEKKRAGFGFLFQYLFRYKKFVTQLIIGLLVGSILQLIFPFLTQSVVDIGIQNQDIDFVYLILIAQLFLFIGRTTVEFIRAWILLHLSTRINISLISDFFIKLMKLPISYFDVKMTGDILQRIGDHKRIERLLTTDSLNVLFSFVNLLLFGAVLAWYDLQIFLVFLVGSGMYFGWVIIFLRRRKELDYKRFSEMGKEQSKVIELINGMQEIKLHNAETQKRWSWEYIQARLFKVSMKSLALEQKQTIGANFINELKNIVISILSAKLVIDGQITLGMMMAISYIIGQLNSPIQQLVKFVYSAQDAKIAIERLAEIHDQEEEEYEDKMNLDLKERAIEFKNVSFRYPGSQMLVLKELDLHIPANKITAIVGSSGSGKTTMMKMILKFYDPNSGEINVGTHNLQNIVPKTWRTMCGAVMQEGYVFNDSIANNICVGQAEINQEQLVRAAEIANIKDFIESLPLGYNTMVGTEGVGMSTGQKQRLLIARAVYKNPSLICFDEATSALDAKNERVIMENLNEFFKNRTAIVIAHRLSTVKNADQIVVLENGQIVERGKHEELLNRKGSYYTLVKNQLELEKLDAK